MTVVVWAIRDGADATFRVTIATSDDRPDDRITHVAKRDGAFADASVDATIVTDVGTDLDALTALREGRADVATVDMLAFATEFASRSGPPAPNDPTVFAVVARATPAVLLVASDASDVRSIADLPGRRLGLIDDHEDDHEGDDPWTRRLLDRLHGRSSTDLAEVEALPSDRAWTALRDGTIDAVLTWGSSEDAVRARLPDGVRPLPDAVVHDSARVLVARRGDLEATPDRFSRILNAYDRAARDIARASQASDATGGSDGADDAADRAADRRDEMRTAVRFDVTLDWHALAALVDAGALLRSHGTPTWSGGDDVLHAFDPRPAARVRRPAPGMPWRPPTAAAPNAASVPVAGAFR
ncbi:MAG: ABC transporter substrate-binding protein [Trueperaceae bacterium]